MRESRLLTRGQIIQKLGHGGLNSGSLRDLARGPEQLDGANVEGRHFWCEVPQKASDDAVEHVRWIEAHGLFDGSADAARDQHLDDAFDLCKGGDAVEMR